MTQFTRLTQNTYKEHLDERAAYNFMPMDYETWLSWHGEDLRREGQVNDQN